jgi:hypothetical protein
MQTTHKRVSVRPTGPSSFAAIDADGNVIRTFSTAAVAWMWLAKRGLYQARTKRKPTATEIPSDLEAERILGMKVLARLSNQSYGTFLEEAKRGTYGPLIKTGARTFGIRFGDWKAAVAQRELK